MNELEIKLPTRCLEQYLKEICSKYPDVSNNVHKEHFQSTIRFNLQDLNDENVIGFIYDCGLNMGLIAGPLYADICLN